MALAQRAARHMLGLFPPHMSLSPSRVSELFHPAVQAAQDAAAPLTTVFLGPPGVGKGTYASRVAASLGLQHVAVGDLVRDEIKLQSAMGYQMAKIVNQGELLPDSLILEMVQKRLAQQHARGQDGVLLDGFPRTYAQANALLHFADVQLVLNLHLRDEVLVEKCMGRRLCRRCGKNFNTAGIDIPASDAGPAIKMPPLDPPPACRALMEVRTDDKYETIKRRLEVYYGEARPIEDVFREAGVLVDFEITGSIPETLPRLLKTIKPVMVAHAEKLAA